MTDTDDDNWGWVRTATNYRRPADLIRNLIDCTSKGGNFVLNVGPTASGEFPVEHKAILQVMGKWLATNGEAIYDTEPAPECAAQPASGLEYYTTKATNHVYLEVLHWPNDGRSITATINRDGFVDAQLLDTSLPATPVDARAANGTTVLSIPKPAMIDPYATVVKLTFKNE